MTGPVMTPLPMPPTSNMSTKPSGTSAQQCPSSDSTADDQLNDDSNPQQGTPSHGQGKGPPMDPPSVPSAPSEGAGMPAPTPGAPSGATGAAKQGTHPTSRQPTSRTGSRDPSSKFPPTVKDIRKLFVGGLPSDVTSEEFRQFFEQYGTVLDSVVMFDRITTRSRGFGFVTFEDFAVGQQLVKMGHVPMRQNKFVEIKPAEPKGSPGMHLNQATAARYHHPSPPYHPAHGRATFGGGMIPVVPATTTTTVAILGETTTVAAMDPSSTAWVPTIPAATTPTRVPFPPPFYPSPTVLMEPNSPITETTTILNGGGMCMDMPTPAPFLMPYPVYPPYDGSAYPNGLGPTTAAPLYSAPVFDLYAAPPVPGGYPAFGYDPSQATVEAPWVPPPQETAPPSEGGVERSS